MPRFCIAALLALLLGPPAFAEAPLPQPDFAVVSRLTPDDPLPERATQWSNPAVSLTDVVYRVIPGYRPLHLDLYRPVAPDSPRPLIVFVHGGGWAHANPRVGAGYADFPAVLGYLAQRGYVVASIEYRFAREAPFPAPLEDLRAAVQFLGEKAARFGIDSARVGLWGMSAGAQLAALAAVACPAGTCIQALAVWSGVYDLRPPYPQNAPLKDYLACGHTVCEAGVLKAASPLLHVGAAEPPVLLVHGQDDRQVAAEQSQRFAAALMAVGVKTDLKLLPGVGHGLIGPDNATTKAALHSGLSATLAFFDRELQRVPAAPDESGR